MLFNPQLIPAGKGWPIDSRATAININIPTAITLVSTGGYAAYGDGGGGDYKRVAVQPTHAGKFQSKDGAWWELVSTEIFVEMFGAKGDNVTNDAVAIQNAIDFDPGVLYFRAKLYAVTAGLLLHNPIELRGANPRDTQILGTGNFNILSTDGLSRISAISIHDMTINGNGMSGGYCVNIDWAQDFLMDNCFLNNPYNGFNIRQAGNTTFRNVVASTVRGTYGLHALGTNTTRNGENDQIDVLCFYQTTIQSDYVSGGAVNNTVLMCLDGYVHTIQCDGLRLLSGGIGLQTLNTNGLAANLTPRFFVGCSLECERFYSWPMDLQYGSNFWVDNIFGVGSYTQDGIRVGANFADFSPKGGSVNTNNLHGVYLNGCPYADLGGLKVYNNSLVGNGVKSGVYISGSGILKASLGLWGKATFLPAYTENQKAGLDIDPAFSGKVCVNDVDLQGNATLAVNDNTTTGVGSFVTNCPGYNPRGGAPLVPTGSPFTYTAGLTPESIAIMGGTVSQVKIGSNVCATTTNCSFALGPRQTIEITYTDAPALGLNRM